MKIFFVEVTSGEGEKHELDKARALDLQVSIKSFHANYELIVLVFVIKFFCVLFISYSEKKYYATVYIE